MVMLDAVALERLDRWEAQLRRYGDIMEQLHQHNEALRQNTMEQIQEPVFRDLIKLIEDYRTMALRWSERARDTDTVAAHDTAETDSGGNDAGLAGQAQRLCAGVVEDLTNLLDRYGVEKVDPLPGLPFDRHLHRAVDTVETHDPAQHERIHSASMPGYQLGRRILRYPHVVVFRHSPLSPGSDLPRDSDQAEPAQQAEAEQSSQAEQDQEEESTGSPA